MSYFKLLNINTKFRPYVKDSRSPANNFLLNLPNPIKDVVSMRVRSAIIPDSEYTIKINETNNQFKLIENNIEKIILIPSGKYDKNDLVNVVNDQLKNNELSVVLEYDKVLQKFLFRPTDKSTNFYFELNFDVNPNQYIYTTFGWLLGFQKSYYSYKTLEKNSCQMNTGLVGYLNIGEIWNYYLADTPSVMPNTSTYYLLSINDYQNSGHNNYIEGCLPSNNTNDQYILSKIPSNFSNNNFTSFFDSNEDSKRVYNNPISLSRLFIKLYDDNNELVELNNADYSFVLELAIKDPKSKSN
jgi:hypothetical protein